MKGRGGGLLDTHSISCPTTVALLTEDIGSASDIALKMEEPRASGMNLFGVDNMINLLFILGEDEKSLQYETDLNSNIVDEVF